MVVCEQEYSFSNVMDSYLIVGVLWPLAISVPCGWKDLSSCLSLTLTLSLSVCVCMYACVCVC